MYEWDGSTADVRNQQLSTSSDHLISRTHLYQIGLPSYHPIYS